MGSASVTGIPILSKNLLLSKKLGFSTASRRDASEAGKEKSEIIRIWRPLCGETLSCKRVALQGKAFSRAGTPSAPPSAPGGRWPAGCAECGPSGSEAQRNWDPGVFLDEESG